LQEPLFLSQEAGGGGGGSGGGLEGRAVSGKLKGQRLQEVPAHTGFWFAQFSFNPTTKVLRP
jgi:hypothetical protein